MSAAGALAGVLAILLPVADVLDGRVDDAAPPPWCARRGWDGFLLSLDDAALCRCEAEGLDGPHVPEGAPADLRDLAARVAAAVRLPTLALAAGPEPAIRAASIRKQRQIPALLGAVAAMAEHASRIVDVGAGRGHFVKLASERFGRETLGIERDGARVASARAAVGEGAGLARFVTLDACRETLAFEEADLAVGLHACGALGDRLVTAATAAGCDVALVSCCLQKIDGPVREPLSRAGAELRLRREALGLTNLTVQPVGVEATLGEMMAARQARYALQRLLRERGAGVAPGEEMRGINRRRARAGLAAIADQALALRGLPPAGKDEIARHEAEAEARYGVVRRLSLPRSMLARLVEIAVVLDRAAALEESGHAVRVGTLFERAVSPRNIGLFASRSEARGMPLFV